MTFKELPAKDKISYILCVASFICGTSLTFIGLFVDPLGVIDASVITSLGIFLTFSGSLIGLNVHYSTELNHFKSEVKKTINDRERKTKEKENTDEQ